ARDSISGNSWVQSWVQLEAHFQLKLLRKLRQTNETLIGYEPEGREFESLRARHSFHAVTKKFPTSVLGAMGATDNFGATVGMWPALGIFEDASRESAGKNETRTSPGQFSPGSDASSFAAH